METHACNLKLASLQLKCQAKACDRAQKEEYTKLKKALQRGNTEGAKIYAENAIRNKNQSLNFKRMASRVEAVSQRVQMAASMGQVSKSMANIVRTMDSAAKKMDLSHVCQLMDRFESQFESLDVQADCMDRAMQSSITSTTPVSEVDEVLSKAADEIGIDLRHELPSMNDTSVQSDAMVTQVDKKQQQKTLAEELQDDLSQRLARLRNMH
ncbi:hypothetical protein ACOME3_010649 [Neoechinorhynchus agilis]